MAQNEYTRNRRSPSGKQVRNGFCSVSSLAELAALVATDAEVGAICAVASLEANFEFTAGLGNTTADGITTIDAYQRTGYYWVRKTAPAANNPWTRIAAWYIDAVNGNDENYGSATLPVRSWDEIARRLGPNPRIGQWTVVTILSDLPTQTLGLGIDPVFTCFASGIRFTASPKTVLFNGTVNAFVMAAAGVEGTLTDAGIADWTTYLGARIRITSGGSTGFSTFVGGLAAAGAGTALVGQPVWRTGNSRSHIVVNTGAIAGGITYNIEQLYSVRGVALKCSQYALDANTYAEFMGYCVENLAFNGLYSAVNQPVEVACENLVPAFVSCAIGKPITGRSVALYGCAFVNNPALSIAICTMIDMNVLLSAHCGGAPTFDHCLVKMPTECQFTLDTANFINGTVSNGTLNFYLAHDTNVPGVLIDITSSIKIGTVIGVLTNVGADADAWIVNGHCWYTAVAGLVPGFGGVDTVIGGAVVAYGALPAITAANGAMMVAAV